ncbi:MAG: FAD-dependent oxidoreductase [Treponema sp.]|jgi:thioredoxin reductase (NADPH)|nr:FAD-dependent oxidoreductase [Treponema sp.]
MLGYDADLLIIGAGPAGLTAAQYGARAGLNVLVIDQGSPGGQALLIDVLENYPGNAGQFDEAGNQVAQPKSGYDFSMDLLRQAESFGASLFYGSVDSIKKENNIFTARLCDGSARTATAVIIASGAKPRFLGIPGEKEFFGKGVSYCASCDGNFFKGKKIFVAGGGDSACDEARYLSRLSDKITLVHRRDSFRAQKALVKRTLDNPNIKVKYNTVIKEIKGGLKVKSVMLADTQTGDICEEEADAVFIFAGTVPQSALVSGGGLNAALDENGYIITDQKMATNVAGLFAAGDIRSGAFRQVVTAAADGALAAHFAAGYIDENQL